MSGTVERGKRRGRHVTFSVDRSTLAQDLGSLSAICWASTEGASAAGGIGKSISHSGDHLSIFRPTVVVIDAEK